MYIWISFLDQAPTIEGKTVYCYSERLHIVITDKHIIVYTLQEIVKLSIVLRGHFPCPDDINTWPLLLLVNRTNDTRYGRCNSHKPTA